MPAAIVAGIGAAGSLIGALTTGAQKRRAEREYERQIGQLKPSESILDYYNKAYNMYAPNAYQSAEYNQQMRNIAANQAAGVGALQSRRSALAGIPSITQATNLASQGAGARAEAAQRANLGLLGQAAQLKTREMQRPEQARLGLAGQRAAALAGTENVWLQNAMSGISTAATALSGGSKS